MSNNIMDVQDNRDNRDLIIMLVTKLDNIENLVSDLRDESRSDYLELQKRFAERNIEITAELNDIKNQVKVLKEDTEKKYVNKDVFQPVKAIVYGITGTSLMGILYAVLKLINLGAK